MPAKRVNENQLDLRRHIRAAEKQQLADELKERIREMEGKIRPYQILVEAAKRAISTARFWAEKDQERRELRRLQREQRALLEGIEYLQWRRGRLGGHPKFFMPVVSGYGLADALRREHAGRHS